MAVKHTSPRTGTLRNASCAAKAASSPSNQILEHELGAGRGLVAWGGLGLGDRVAPDRQLGPVGGHDAARSPQVAGDLSRCGAVPIHHNVVPGAVFHRKANAVERCETERTAVRGLGVGDDGREGPTRYLGPERCASRESRHLALQPDARHLLGRAYGHGGVRPLQPHAVIPCGKQVVLGGCAPPLVGGKPADDIPWGEGVAPHRHRQRRIVYHGEGHPRKRRVALGEGACLRVPAFDDDAAADLHRLRAGRGHPARGLEAARAMPGWPARAPGAIA